MAEKCTNTSSPFSREMKPKPLASLNHFTVPCSICFSNFLIVDVALRDRKVTGRIARTSGGMAAKRAVQTNAAELYTKMSCIRNLCTTLNRFSLLPSTIGTKVTSEHTHKWTDAAPIRDFRL